MRLGHRHDRRRCCSFARSCTPTRAPLRRAHCRVFHFPRVKHRRVPHAAWRPPLFLGYLAGVPFMWTLRLAPMWISTTVVLLVIYFIWDTRMHKREPPERLRLDATRNQAVAPGRPGKSRAPRPGHRGRRGVSPAPWREIAMVAGCTLMARTSEHIHHANRFTLRPILEVAVIFLGIFATMIPALDILRARRRWACHPWQYFWAAGSLSSFLDNAPTYLTFLALGQGQHSRPRWWACPPSSRPSASVPCSWAQTPTSGTDPISWSASIAKPRHKDAEFWRLHAIQWRDLRSRCF